MIPLIILPALILTGIVAIVYLTYFFASSSKKTEKINSLSEYPPISIIFPAHNEEKVIDNRIKNLAESDYPVEKMKLIIVNDASEDGTEDIALKAMEKYGIKGRVVNNNTRSGVNFSMSRGIKEAENDAVVCTDADVYFCLLYTSPSPRDKRQSRMPFPHTMSLPFLNICQASRF